MIVVTNLNDSGAGSFRDALGSATTGEEITFSVTGTITLTTGELTIGDDVIVTGPGSGSLTIDANSSARCFSTLVGVISISGMTLINGSEIGGAGIHNEATLTLDDVVITDCASFSNGGGIENTGTVAANDLTITGCSAVGEGGGIWSNGTVGVDISPCTNVVVTDCTSDAEGGGIWNDGTVGISGGEVTDCASDGIDGGGGIYHEGTLYITDLTISGNSSTNGNGGGIHNVLGSIEITRCTFSGNDVMGIYNTNGTVEMDNSTVSGHGVSGGIYNQGGVFTVLHSTIVANNVGVVQDPGSQLTIQNTILSGSITDYEGDTADVTSLGNNIFGVNTNPITPAAGDQSILTYAQLVIGPLQDNGGPTFTHALLATSPAIDSGNNTGAPDTDQRGFPRVVDGTIDIGAFESDIDPEPPIPPEPDNPPDPPAPTPSGRLKRCPSPPEDCGFLGVRADNATPGIANLSSEAPDADISVFVPYPPPYVQPPLTGGGGNTGGNDPVFPPPTNPVIKNNIYTGPQPCTGQIYGQFGATLSGQIPVECSPWVTTDPGWLIPPSNPLVPPEPYPTFPNAAQTATALCPDGSVASYTVPVNTYFEPTFQLANLKAASAAQKIVISRLTCFIGSFNACCVGNSCSNTIVVTGTPRLLTWEVVLGELPTGLVMTSLNGGMALQVSGFPDTAGLYTFSLRTTDAVGVTQTKTYTMSIMEITTTLPDPVVGVAYSQQLEQNGGTGDLVWALASGTLPTGLALDEAGLLAGTPTDDGLFIFTVSVTNSGGTCTREYMLNVALACVAFNPLTYTLNNFPSLGVVIRNEAENGNISQRVEGNGASCDATAFKFYTQRPFLANLHVDWLGSGASIVDSFFTINISGPGVTFIQGSWDVFFPTPGSYDIPLTFSASDGTDSISITVVSASLTVADFMDVVVTLTCVECPVFEDLTYVISNTGTVNDNTALGGYIHQDVIDTGSQAVATAALVPYPDKPAQNFNLRVTFSGTGGLGVDSAMAITILGPGVFFGEQAGGAVFPFNGTYDIPMTFAASGPTGEITVQVDSQGLAPGHSMEVTVELTCLP